MTESLEQRFWRKVKRVPIGCWEWTGAKNSKGYGQISNEIERHSHRLSWHLCHGAIADGMYILHTCDNPACVRPSHLFLGTAKDNTHDMLRKGRNRVPRGEKHVFARLTEADVREILTSSLSGPSLARKYGVTHQHIYNIRSGKKWAALA